MTEYTTQQRIRPYGTPVQLAAQHRNPVTVHDLLIHGIRDGAAVKLSMTSTGDTLPNGEHPTFGFASLTDLEIFDIARKSPGTHNDCIFLQGSMEPAIRPNGQIRNVYCHDTDGSTMTILLESGKWGTFVVRDVRAVNVGNNMIVGGTGDTLVLDNVDLGGKSIDIAGTAQNAGLDWKRVVVKKCPGQVVRNVGGSRATFIRDDNYPTPEFDAAGKIIAATRPTTAPVDPTIALKAQIAGLVQENAGLKGQVAELSAQVAALQARPDVPDVPAVLTINGKTYKVQP